MATLSNAELQVAYEYCKGLSDKEVADNLNKSIWTTKSQKKSIYRKLGISKDTELLLYMLCEKFKVDFDLKEIRKHGLEILFSILFIVIQITGDVSDMTRMKTRSVSRTSIRTGARLGRRNNNELDLTTIL